MKRFIKIILTATTLSFLFASTVFAESSAVNITLVQRNSSAGVVNKYTDLIENAPYLSGKNAMVSIDFIAELLSIPDEDIIFDKENKTMSLNYKDINISFKENTNSVSTKKLSNSTSSSSSTSSSATGSSSSMKNIIMTDNAKAEIKEDCFFIPMKIAAELFELNMQWNSSSKSLTITFTEGSLNPELLTKSSIEIPTELTTQATTQAITIEASTEITTDITDNDEDIDNENTESATIYTMYTTTTAEPTTETTTKMQFETTSQININNLFNQNTNLPESIEKINLGLKSLTGNSYYSRDAKVKNNYIYKKGENFVTVTVLDTKYNTVNELDDSKEVVYVTTFDKNFNKISEQKVDFGLPIFGGFYTNGVNNFMVFGQANPDESNSETVFEIVKYDMNFKRLASTYIHGRTSNTVAPFEYGSLSMSENNGELVVHTSRLHYEDKTGVNQQSQITFVIDVETMKLKNNVTASQDNLVTHSFNQFVKSDSYGHVLVDHGDAYPRSIVLNRNTSTNKYQSLDLLEIPGQIGQTNTGVSVGGLEISDTSYLVPINKVNFNLVTNYESYVIESLEKDIVLLVADKDLDNVQNITLKQYVGTGKTSGTPQIVSIGYDQYIILWEEHEIANSSVNKVTTDVKYMRIDGRGNVLIEAKSLPGVTLSEVQPIYDNGYLIWFVNSDLYKLNLYN